MVVMLVPITIAIGASFYYVRKYAVSLLIRRLKESGHIPQGALVSTTKDTINNVHVDKTLKVIETGVFTLVVTLKSVSVGDCKKVVKPYH